MIEWGQNQPPSKKKTLGLPTTPPPPPLKKIPGPKINLKKSHARIHEP